MSSWRMGQKLSDVEKEVILDAFRFYQFDKNRTALSLGIARRTLDNKLEQYGKDHKDDWRLRGAFSSNQFEPGVDDRTRGEAQETTSKDASTGVSSERGDDLESTEVASKKRAVHVRKQ